ncbi:MAG TPA: hypothetical protein VNL71_08310 [Chloroflexota bacterium]|nr:hypothetical protein [Chloroflexota bacterium]
MKKISVYRTQEEADSLRRLAATTGKTQAELMRAGIHWVLTSEDAVSRRFHSLGKGHADGASYEPWNPEDLYKSVMEKSPCG